MSWGLFRLISYDLENRMMRVADCPGAVIGCFSALIHNIRKFESDVLLPVHHL